MSANNHTCIGDQIFGSTVETKTWDRKNVRALHTNSSAADPHFTCKCCVYVFSWEWNSIIIQRDHQSQSSTNCLGVSWVTAVTVGKSECAYVCVCGDSCEWWLTAWLTSPGWGSGWGGWLRMLPSYSDASFPFLSFQTSHCFFELWNAKEKDTASVSGSRPSTWLIPHVGHIKWLFMHAKQSPA